MKCTSCLHYRMCIFRLKAQNVINNHSHMFRKGSYTLLGQMACVCKYYQMPGHIEAGSLADLEKRCILSAMIQSNNCKVAAAKLLNIGERTLYRKLAQYKENA